MGAQVLRNYTLVSEKDGMRIKKINTTPLLVKNKQPYHWAHGVILGAEVILVEIETEQGVLGYGESIATPSVSGIQAFIDLAAKCLVEESVFESQPMIRQCYHRLFQAQGTCSAPGFGGQILAGLEMAMWDARRKNSWEISPSTAWWCLQGKHRVFRFHPARDGRRTCPGCFAIRCEGTQGNIRKDRSWGSTRLGDRETG